MKTEKHGREPPTGMFFEPERREKHLKKQNMGMRGMIKQKHHVLIYSCAEFNNSEKKRRFYLFTIYIFAYLCAK